MRHLSSLQSWLVDADPKQSLTKQSAFLCAALAYLAETTCEALGGDQFDRVGRAAAMLSLLTKIDDEVIDSMAFHGGRATDRGLLRRRTWAQLMPTLQSILTGVPALDEGRCRLAACLGRDVADLALSPRRLVELTGLIAHGWSVQVDAVDVFTAHPNQVTLDQVMRVTAEISGAWLMMVAMMGTLTAQRNFTDAEQAAFFTWGLHIQSADALCDLDKDLACGLVGTRVGQLGFAALGDRWLELSSAQAYRQVADLDLDLACLPADVGRCTRALSSLGGVAETLASIHGFLLGRYLLNPHCKRKHDAAEFLPFVSQADGWLSLYKHARG